MDGFLQKKGTAIEQHLIHLFFSNFKNQQVQIQWKQDITQDPARVRTLV